MELLEGYSPRIIRENIKRLERLGHSHKKSVSIATRKANEYKKSNDIDHTIVYRKGNAIK